jgi:hypothetical protein
MAGIGQGVAKLPFQILGALSGKSAIMGLWGKQHYPDLVTLLHIPGRYKIITFICLRVAGIPATGIWPSQGKLGN